MLIIISIIVSYKSFTTPLNTVPQLCQLCSVSYRRSVTEVVVALRRSVVLIEVSFPSTPSAPGHRRRYFHTWRRDLEKEEEMDVFTYCLGEVFNRLVSSFRRSLIL